MRDITILGNLYIDSVYNKETGCLKYSPGGIVNVWKHLLTINPRFSLDVLPLRLGEAFICVDPMIGLKLSTVVKKVKDDLFSLDYIERSKWYHIAYLDQLDDWSFFKKIQELHVSHSKPIISVDIADDVMENLEFVDKLIDHSGLIDYVLITRDAHSDDWLNSLLPYVNIAVIAHDSKGCTVYHHGDLDIYYGVDPSNGNVLGAGDAFAASFIHSVYHELPTGSSCILQYAIGTACDYATNWIQTRND